MRPDAQSAAFEWGVLLTLYGLSAVLFFPLAALYPAAEWLQMLPIKVLWVLLSLFVALFLRVSLFGRFGDPWQRLAAAYAVFGAFLLLPLIIAKEMEQRWEAAQAEDLRLLRREVRLEQARRLHQERLEMQALLAQQPRDRFSVYQNRIPLGEIIALRELDARMQALLDAKVAAYQEALGSEVTRGVSEWILFQQPEAFDVELSAYRQLYLRSRQLRDFTAGFEEQYLSELEALDLSEPGRRVGIAELERIVQVWQREGTLELRELDTEALATAIAALQILQRSWGNWRYSIRDGGLQFDDEETQWRFSEAIMALDEIFAELARLRSEANRFRD